MRCRLAWICIFVLIALLLSGCGSLRQAIQNRPCGLDPSQPYDTVHINPALHNITLHWKSPETDEPFKTINNLVEWLENTGHSIVAVTNGGIFEPGLVPTGLYVENGQELQPLNLNDGYGNFYMKPNGVFFVRDGLFGIEEATHFGTGNADVDYALQSGPLILQDNQIHPAFTPGSKNCRLRSGIGVSPNGHAILAISNGAVNLNDFATWFRDTAGMADALYLDGAISTLYTREHPSISGEHYAGFLVVSRKKE